MSEHDSRHAPVMRAEVVEALSPRDGARYVDGTFGAGGYTRAILDAADTKVLGIDRDPTAIAAGRAMEAEYEGRLVLASGCFGDLDDICEENGFAPVDGIALDLGVSSMQLDEAERGFSFRMDGPLDMRMGGEAQGGLSAADVVNTYGDKDLARIFRILGEERRAGAVARAICRRREDAPFARTGELADLVASVVGSKNMSIHPATRVFQALRIYVNDELGELARGLVAAERVLAAGGRLAVVSFHSLEDRIVKRFLAARAGGGPNPSRHLPEASAGPEPSFRLLSRKAIAPTDEETDANPRARSAKLRAAERTDAPALAEDEGSVLGLPRLPVLAGGAA